MIHNQITDINQKVANKCLNWSNYPALYSVLILQLEFQARCLMLPNKEFPFPVWLCSQRNWWKKALFVANKKQDICKKQFLKIEDFVYVINVISVWTSVHKIIVFFETKCFNSSKYFNWSRYAQERGINFIIFSSQCR